LGGGSFGEIYVCLDTRTQTRAAVKLEPIATKTPQLLYEAKILKHLRQLHGVPQVLWYGTEPPFHILVMTLLGPSLEDILNYNGRQLSVRSVIQVAEEMIQRVEDVHSLDYLHRDIKPDNFLLGRDTHARTVLLIDFGLAKRYRDIRTRSHIPYKEEKELIGTARYASLNTHLGLEQSRRDDLEALGYIFVYLLRGKLPWQGLPRSSHKDKYHGIMEAKMRTSLQTLCSDLQTEFCGFLQYCRTLKFEEKPDYLYLKRLIGNVASKMRFEIVGKFDWEVTGSEVQSVSSSGKKLKNKRSRRGSSSRKLVVFPDQSRANKTQGATPGSASTEGECRIGPELSQKARNMISQFQAKPPPQSRARSTCILF
jgi:casein kinase 1